MSRPDIDEADIAAVVDVLRSGRLALGPHGDAFERSVAEFVGSRHAVAVSSGTAALHLILDSLGIGPGDEVLVPSFTFAATANVVLFQGARPVFVDITPDNLAMDPEDVARKVNPRTRAAIGVDVFGHPADWDALAQATHGRDVEWVADACEALGARYRGRPVGSQGRAATFGFYPNKQITTGEGGMIVTDDAELARTTRALRNQGRTTTGAWLDHTMLGYNYRMDEMSAALGCSQMSRIHRLLDERAAVARAYDMALEGIDGLRRPQAREDVVVSWFVYVVTLARGIDRTGLMQRLEGRGIPTRAYFPPLHLQPYLRDRLGTAPGDLPVTEAIAARTVALPFHGGMAPEDIEAVAQAVREELM